MSIESLGLSQNFSEGKFDKSNLIITDTITVFINGSNFESDCIKNTVNLKKKDVNKNIVITCSIIKCSSTFIECKIP